MNCSDTDIRRIIESRADAVRKGNLEAMGADVADDVTVFDVVASL